MDKTTRDQIRKFDYESKRNEGQIRFDRKSGFAHKKQIIDICTGFLLAGKQFYTRARHQRSGKVADIYDPEWNAIIEVMDSESEESIQEKEKFWRSEGFNFEVIRCEKNKKDSTKSMVQHEN
jgi:hypothetical protein